VNNANTAATGKVSLDDREREQFRPSSVPLGSPGVSVAPLSGVYDHPAAPASLNLNGEWEMAAEGDAAARLNGEWSDAIPAVVPGSVHAALLRAGAIPNPYVGKNDEIARAYSFKTWWFKRIFRRLPGMERERLVFGGVCDACEVWLNGHKLGNHRGMFGGPSFEIGDRLVDGENTLIVKLFPAPFRERTTEMNDFFNGMNVGWLHSAVFNNVYGWHYINLPALGIWRPVTIESRPAVSADHPFVATRHAANGEMALIVDLNAAPDNNGTVASGGGIRGHLAVSVQPDNFAGEAYHFEHRIDSASASARVRLDFRLPDPQLWWPNGYGGQPLYRLRLSFVPADGGSPERKETTFGIRTIEMRPLPQGPDPSTYNWTFIVNDRPVFVKGTNWCTMDALMRFDAERYDRFLSLARDAHHNLLRAWGSGMPETDEFYELADRYGLMVMQEWPTAWDSDRVQPFDVLEETVRLNTLRLRNRPSLIMWGGGNESANPTGPVVDMFGRLAYELDGTRPFHRGEPWGGSVHDYHVYWGRQPLDYNLSLTAPFIGEFGLASLPNMETVNRYLPEEERGVWPVPEDGAFVHHTPVFNLKECMRNLAEYVPDFLPPDRMANFVLGTQLAQATGIRHTLELARNRRPDCAGVAYYKLNDNNPAASWATVDWFGNPKPAYYIVQDAYAPLHAAVLIPELNPVGKELALPVVLFDDNHALTDAEWSVNVRAYGGDLALLEAATFRGNGATGGSVRQLGELILSKEQTRSVPLFLVAEVVRGGELADRTFYWLNYKEKCGSLFDLPAASLAMERDGGDVVVANLSDKPAVAVQLDFADAADADHCRLTDNFFWLEAGESKRIGVKRGAISGVFAWNAKLQQ